MNDQIYDIIIIGAGPAGITAGVYAARKKIKCLVLTMDIGGQAAWSGDIENYTGYQFITGPDLASKFEEHIKNYKIDVKEGTRVKSLEKKDGLVHVITEDGEYTSYTAVIASGKRTKELGVKGEQEYKNKGVTYCATCDGPVFEGKDVLVVGGGNSALDAVLQLVRIANKVYVVNIASDLTGDIIERDKIMSYEKVQVFNESEVTEIFGEKFVSGVKFKNRDNEEKTLEVQGVFIEIGLRPNSEFVTDIEKNKIGEIIVNCQTETSIPGVFAAGDVTNVIEKQIIIAAGEGAKASLRAFKYLSGIK